MRFTRALTIITVFLIGSASSIHAQKAVKWLTIDEALERSEQEGKKIFVDMYTDWCGWCKKMDKATFQHPEVAKYLNENYLPVKFNAEQKSDVIYRDKTYKYIRKGRQSHHELAAKFSETLGGLSFPTIVFIDENQLVIQPIPGFQNVKDFSKIMRYFAEDHYKNTSWQSFSANYDKAHK